MIYLKAQILRKKYKINSKSSLEYLKLVIHQLGYNLSTYSEEKIKLARLKRDEEMKTAPSLSVIDKKGNITVYYNDTLPSFIQRFALAHEIGHIKLGHTRRNLKGEKQEREADKFAEYLLSPSNNRKIEKIHITCIILCLCLSLVSLYKIFTIDDMSEFNSAIINIENQKTSTNNNSEISYNITCYYARYSEVYHLYKDCYYLKNSKKIYTDTVDECHLDRLCSACERRKNTD